MRLQEEEQQGEQKMHQTAARDSGLFLQKLTFKVTLYLAEKKWSHHLQYPQGATVRAVQ